MITLQTCIGFLLDFTALPGRKILVHGGGKVATDLGVSLGVEAKMVEGRRITDIETLKDRDHGVCRSDQ